MLCLVSAGGFGAMAIFAKLAYGAGFDIPTLLTLRFALAAAVLWAVVAVRRPALPRGRTLLKAIGLGAAGYALQAALFFASLQHIEASLASLLLYVYPALVLLGGVAIGREQVGRRRAGALVLAGGGMVLVLAGGGAGALNGTGVELALASAAIYSAYILLADRVAAEVDPIMLTALIVTSAAVAVGAFTAATGGPHLAVAPGGWAALTGVALISTVVPILTFLVGMRRVGPASAAIVSTAEPVVTVALAMLVFGEHLAPVQALGGALVGGAVVLINARLRSRRGLAAVTSARAAARSLAQHAAGG